MLARPAASAQNVRRVTRDGLTPDGAGCPETAVGEATMPPDVPLPSAPSVLSPQQLATPAAMSHTRPPVMAVLTDVTDVCPVAAVGVATTLAVDPLPITPNVPIPQQYVVLALTPHVYANAALMLENLSDGISVGL